jgi:hypothetical protein
LRGSTNGSARPAVTDAWAESFALADDVASLVERTASRATRSDPVAVARVAIDDRRGLATAGQVVINPVFSQSMALGGADADVIADGVLLDFKSSATTRVARNRDLWKVVGYALADTGDLLELSAVGVAALRWRTTFVWPPTSCWPCSAALNARCLSGAWTLRDA